MQIRGPRWTYDPLISDNRLGPHQKARLEPGVAYPVSELDRYFHQQVVDAFMRRPSRDALFIEGRLD